LRNNFGIGLPSSSACFSIERAYIGLKQYSGSCCSVSIISDNEHPTAPLRDSEVLRVKHTPGPPIPEFAQRPENGSQIPSVVRRQKAWDIFDENPCGTTLSSKAHEVEEKSGLLASQSSTASSH